MNQVIKRDDSVLKDVSQEGAKVSDDLRMALLKVINKVPSASMSDAEVRFHNGEVALAIRILNTGKQLYSTHPNS